MQTVRKNLAAGRWQELSLMEQLGNIGGEISRAVLWRGKDENLFQQAIDRSLELLDFTIQDSRWSERLKEIVRARELICEAAFGENQYKTSLQDLNQYFLIFAIAARLSR